MAKTVKINVEVPVETVRKALRGEEESMLTAMLASSYDEFRQAVEKLPTTRLIRLSQAMHGVLYKRLQDE